MRGEVLTYDDGPGTGLISGDDGARYTFSRADLQQLAPVRAGVKVDFVAVDGVATQVIITAQQGGYAQSAYGSPGGYTPGVAGSGGGAFDWKTLFLQPAGRIGQKDFWIGFGILFVGGIVVGLIPVLGGIIALGLTYCWVCLYSKRLHDMGKSGWLAAIPTALPALLGLISIFAIFGSMGAAAYGDTSGMMASLGALGALGLLSFLVVVGFAIWCGVTVGDQGDNAYGPPPLPLANF